MSSGLACGILAGGTGTRLGGREKALIEIAGRPLLAHVLDRLRPRFSEILLSTNRPELFAWTKLQCVPDRLQVRSPLAGLHGLLTSMRAPRVFVFACDMPGASLKLADRLAQENADAVVPVSPSGDEPLHAVYSPTCVPEIERAASEGRWGMIRLLDHVRTVRVTVDPGEWTESVVPPFFNLNTPDDLVTLNSAFKGNR